MKKLFSVPRLYQLTMHLENNLNSIKKCGTLDIPYNGLTEYFTALEFMDQFLPRFFITNQISVSYYFPLCSPVNGQCNTNVSR